MKPLVIGHRGAPTIALENTLPSFKAAIDIGVDMVELDVQATADGVLVVFHDYDLSRLGTDSRLIAELTYDELKTIPIGDDYFIPTLADVLELAKGKVMVNVEIKTPDIELQTLECVQQHDMMDDVLFSSFFHQTLSSIKEIEPKANTGILFNQPIEGLIEYTKSLKANAVNPLFFLLEPQLVEELKEADLKVFPWTVNDEEMILEIARMGVDGIITDVPDLCFKVLETGNI